MQQNFIQIYEPPAKAEQLFLLFHGVGATEEGLIPVGKYLAGQFPSSSIVSIRSPDDCDFSSGYQWFSVNGITDENRELRISSALPKFVKTVRHWQTATNLDATATALFGFSQGAIMVLEASKTSNMLAARIIAHSGRYASLPQTLHAKMTVHLIHGKQDSVVPYQYCIEAAHHLKRIGADFTADVIPYLGHEINGKSLNVIGEHLTGHVPKYAWDAALEAGVPGA